MANFNRHAVTAPAPRPDELRSPAWWLMERSAAATLVAELGGRVTYVNPAFLSLWRLDGAWQVLGRQATDAEFWVDERAARTAIQALTSATVWQGELVARCADGSEVPVRVTTQILVDDAGAPSAMLGNYVDISSERAALDAWRREREFTEVVVGGAGVLVAALDEEGRFVRFNTECERVSGWRAEEVLGRCPWDTVLPPETVQAVRDSVFGVAMSQAGIGQISHHTNDWLNRDGSRRRIDWTNRVVQPGKDRRKFMITVGIDVTSKAVTERALRASEEQLRRAQTVAKLGSWTLDCISGQLDWSDEVFRLFELDRQRFVPTYEAFLGVVHPDDRDLVASTYEGSLLTREPYRIEHRLLMSDGRIKWVEERCETDFDAMGHSLVSRGTVQDVTDRRRGEIELQRFRHMVEDAPEEAWLTNEDFQVVYANAAACASLGLTQQDLIGRHLAEIDAGGEKSLRRIAEAVGAHQFTRRSPQAFRVDHRAGDGRLIPKEIHATVRSIDGRPHGISFGRDISDRLREQQALADSEELLREALDTYPGWVACVDEQMRYVFVNAQFCQIAGKNEADIVGRTADEVLGPARSEERWAVHRRLMSGEQKLMVERHFVDQHGRERIAWIQYRSVVRKTGGRHFYAYAIDVTEHRHTQSRLSSVTQGITAGLWECMYPCKNLECNDELLAIIGHARADLQGNMAGMLFGLIHPDDRAMRRDIVKTLVDEQVVQRPFQYRIRHRDGSTVWLQEHLRVLSRDTRGQPLRIIGVLQDISILKSREAELQQLNADLERRIEQRTRALVAAKEDADRASAAKSEFLSQMSHELRTPLNAIIGFGQLLELSPLGNEDAEHAREVVRAGHHLQELIDDILDLATVESGRVVLHMGPVQLRDLVDECVRLMRPVALASGQTLEVGVIPVDACVLADRGRLKQVLLNLLSNAIKFNRKPAGRVALNATASGTSPDGWELQVSDNGPGLDEYQLKKLFQPFERLGIESTAVKGTGIGLAISKKLVDLMGGAIAAKGTADGGSTFSVRLVRAPADESDGANMLTAAGKWAPPMEDHWPRRRRVLYVEDHEANLLLMQRMLAKVEGIELRMVRTAEAALELTDSFTPDLLLLDIRLPGIDGIELLRQLRAKGLMVPAVALSASAMPGDVMRGRSAGFAEYLSKPLNLGQVVRIVQDLVFADQPPREPVIKADEVPTDQEGR